MTRISPLQAGIVLALMCGICALIVAPFIIIAALAGREGAVMGIALSVMLPLFYAVVGFFGGLIGAALYNLIAGWTGGLEFEVSEETTIA